jgi:nucleoid-associated protein YgaU
MALGRNSRYTEGEFTWAPSDRGSKFTVYLNTVTRLTVSYSVYYAREGDMLWNLANRFYDDPREWPILADANPHVFNPFVDIRPGTMLRVPS